jgi:N-acetylmuramoyl-L-alanine amidase
MENSSTASAGRSTNSRSSGGTFHHIGLVISVAFVLATLFTAWSPANLLTGSPSQSSNTSIFPPPTSEDASSATATPLTNPLIGIVVGHWGDNNDPGAVCLDTNLTEFEVNQNIATLVKSDLEAKGIDVQLLKEFDPKLRGFQATALVSIHADSCEYINDQATGFKVAAALANPRPERGARLTACLRSRYARVTGLALHSTSITNDMTSYHAFDEISENTTAVIIETGFMNLDRQLLEQHPDIAAEGITQGILCFINNEDVSSPPTPTTSP